MIFLGTSGWYYSDWINDFYPKDIKKSQWLSFYSSKFDTVEVNSSFYRLPFENMVKGWVNKTPDDFILTFKGNQFITHLKKLKDIEHNLKLFHDRVFIAKDKLGVILWQLPPSLKKDIELLESFLVLLDSKASQVIEFRDVSWFDSEVYNLLERYNIGFCIISCPQFPPVFKITADFAYIRWHGLRDWYNDKYSEEELLFWADKIKEMDTNRIYGYFNNDYNCYAVDNCLFLKKILNDK